ncbi:MAG: leucine-rich repeat protein, partial [Eubacteriales bacterium]
MKSMKKIMYVLSVAMLIALLLAVAVMAETATGKFGVFGATDGSESALTWTFAPEKFTVDGVEYEANTLVISGTGTTWTYESGTVGYMNGGWNVSGFPWTAYHASVEKIVITAPITKIPAKAFARHFKLTTVLFPETYKEFDTSEPFNEIKTLKTIGVTGKDVVEGVWDFRNFTYINNEYSLLYTAVPSPVIFLPADAKYKSVETNDTGSAGMLALYAKYALNAKFFVTAGSDGEKIANNTKKNASGWYTSSSFVVSVTTGYDYDPTKVEETGPVIPSGGGTSGDTTTSGFSPYWPVAEDGKSGTFGIYTATDETKNALKWTYDTVKFTVDDVEYDPFTLVITGTGAKWSYPEKTVSYVSGGWTYKGLPWYHLRNDIKKVVIATESVTSFPANAFAGMTKMETFLFPQNYTEFRATSMFNGSNKLTTIGYNGTEYVRGVIDLRKMTYIDNSCAISWFANSSEIVWLPETCTYKTTEVGETGSAGIFVLYDNNSTAITFACVAGTDGEKIAKQTQENKNGYHKNKSFSVTIVYEYIAPEILDTPEDIADTFDYSIYEKATASGHLVAGSYCNANWYYFEDTKTLMYLAATTGYTETGTIAAAEDKIGWADYKNDIEHIVIGPGISKITGGAFADMSAVKDIRLGSNITRCSSGTFKGCSSLTTIWRANGERVE